VDASSGVEEGKRLVAELSPPTCGIYSRLQHAQTPTTVRLLNPKPGGRARFHQCTVDLQPAGRARDCSCASSQAHTDSHGTGLATSLIRDYGRGECEALGLSLLRMGEAMCIHTYKCVAAVTVMPEQVLHN